MCFKLKRDISKESKAVLGALEVEKGRISIFTDSTCLEEAKNLNDPCFEILDAMIKFTSKIEEEDQETVVSELREWLTLEQYKLDKDYNEIENLPKRLENINFEDVSFVLSQPIQCYKYIYLKFKIKV